MVSDIVQSDYRTADVFKRYGISYCCCNQASLMEVCIQKNIETEGIISELNEATRNINLSNKINFHEWKMDFLVDYIVNVHHAYIYRMLPELAADLATLSSGHKEPHPELERALSVFNELSVLLLAHVRHEEEIIFPYIKQIENAYRRKESYGNLFVRTLRKPLHNIEVEHHRIYEVMTELRKFTSHYGQDSHTCANHNVVLMKLKEFDDDMRQHTHLENDILFPRAIEMEKELLQ